MQALFRAFLECFMSRKRKHSKLTDHGSCPHCGQFMPSVHQQEERDVDRNLHHQGQPVPIIQTTVPDDVESHSLRWLPLQSPTIQSPPCGSLTKLGSLAIQRTISEYVEGLDLGSFRSDAGHHSRASSSVKSSHAWHYQISQNVLLLDESRGQIQMRKLKDLKEDTQETFDIARACTATAEKLLPSPSYVHGGAAGMATTAKRAKAIIEQITNQWEANHIFQWEPSDKFAQEAIELCRGVQQLLEDQEYPLLHLQSPIYILGDLHGNFNDMYFYLSNLINFGDMRYTGNSFLFLGDYVDKGSYSIEVVMYLLALKVIAPEQIWLLRGNHETREMQSTAPHGFFSQCHQVFGKMGDALYEAVHRVFDSLPLAAIIDHRIFCVHGGIPRLEPVQLDDRLDFLVSAQWKKLRGTESLQEVGDTDRFQRFFTDLLWADPALEEEEADVDDCGFGASARGPVMSTFGNKAIAKFLDSNGLQFIIRAHEWMDFGMQVAKHGKVITIFSSSRYNNQDNNSAILFISAADKKIRFVSKGHHGQ